MDHREIGQKLKLFMFHPYSPGNVIWLPNGNIIYSILADKMRKLNKGYVEVRTPVMWKKDLFEQSGHWDHFAENMFKISCKEEEVEETFALKPMNCPAHMLIYKSQHFSYRDLPYRIHDQGLLHRNEVSGALGGLTRCRSFCQDDGHIFLTENQLEAEINQIYTQIINLYKIFGMSVRSTLSTRPESFMGDPILWDKAEHILENILGDNCEIDKGGGAFYGPKIDFKIKDSLNREFQTATIQLDFQLPKRFELEYTDMDNQPKTPIVVHRAMFGSFERFIGILLEHYKGILPSWLCPIQATILSITERSNNKAKIVYDSFLNEGIRTSINLENLTLNKKIKFASESHIPYVIIVGDKEVLPNVNLRHGGKNNNSNYFDILNSIHDENIDF